MDTSNQTILHFFTLLKKPPSTYRKHVFFSCLSGSHNIEAYFVKCSTIKALLGFLDFSYNFHKSIWIQSQEISYYETETCPYDEKTVHACQRHHHLPQNWLQQYPFQWENPLIIQMDRICIVVTTCSQIHRVS